MSPDPPSSLREIFLEVVELEDLAARDAFLSRACAGDPALRARVESLLAADAVPARTKRPLPPKHRRSGHGLPSLPDRIDRYRIVEKIGEGGCGTVFLAEQDEPVRRRVALKVIKLGMDTREVVARFEAERQALALMDHPHIARVLDAGATGSGQPYFVMEWVRGSKITEFCEAGSLDLRQRIELVLDVCQAVQHAHQKGIIHRDLKPSNILVSRPEGARVPVPKVIDFGIAKAVTGRLTDDTLFTAVEQMMGTPAYMSPEQAAGHVTDIDTRTDVYSLGVLLYQLLTGQTPFETHDLVRQGLEEMRRTIREVEPERPSKRIQTSTRLKAADGKENTGFSRRSPHHDPANRPGDLDWIVMKCLEKDRARRYETVNALAQDLRCWLNHEPVSARPPSTAYRLQKWVRRNRTVFAATCAALLALVTGLTAATVMFIREKRARSEVEAQRVVAERQRREFQQRAYASDMKLAQHLVDRFDLKHALDILERHRPAPGDTNDLRAFEWRYLWERCQGSPHDSLPGSVGMPWALAVSPDGRFVAAASNDGRDAGVTVWNLNTREVAARLEFDATAGGDSAGVAFSEDGSKILTACHRRVQFFETGTWRELPELALTNASGPIDLRGDTLVTTAVGHMNDPTRFDGLTVWNLRTRASEAIAGVTGPPTLSVDGRKLALRSESGIEIRRVDQPAARLLLLEGSSEVLVDGSGYGSLRRGLAFSPDGRRIAAPGQADERGDIPVLIWDANNGRRIDGNRLIGHEARIQSLDWAPDGRRLATASADGTLRVWDVDGLSKPLILTGHLSEPWCVTFAPQGNAIISSGIQTRRDEVKIWPLDRAAAEPEITGEWMPLWLSQDGSLVFTGSNRGVGAYRELVSGRVIERLEAPSGMPPAISSTTELHILDGEGAPAAFLGFPEGKVASWCIGSDKFPRLLEAHLGTVRVITSLPDQRMLITGGDDRSIHWWSLDTGGLVRSNHLSQPVTALAVSPDGKTLMSAACEQDSGKRGGRMFQLAEWDTGTGKLRSTIPLPGFTSALGFSPDGRWLAARAHDEKGAGHTHLFDLGSRIWRPRLDRDGRRFDFSPDGSHLLVWSTLWDLRAHPPQSKVLSGHRQQLMNQTFSPDSRTVVSTGDDGTVRLWSVATGQEMLSFVEPGRSFDSPIFSADGTTLAVGSFRQDGRPIRFWHAPTLKEIDERIREGRMNR